ncbi:MAG: ABC transporter permease, partial [Bacilli bacterium]|nr:ABC transporter permease [Bacilli bacterium]
MNLLNKLTKKSLILNKKRTIFTIIGIMLSTALLVTVTTIYSSGIKSLINFETFEKGNYHVGYVDVKDNDQKNIILNNKHVKVSSVTKSFGYAKINSKNEYKPYAQVVGFDDVALKNLSVRLKSGRLPKNDSEVLVPTHLATNGRVKYNVGDTITLDLGTRVDIEGNILKQNDLTALDEFGELEESLINLQTKEYKVVGVIERLDSSVESYDSPGYILVTYLDKKTLKSDDVISIYNRYDKSGLKQIFSIVGGVFGISNDLSNKKFNEEDPTVSFTNEELNEINTKINIDIQINEYLLMLENDPLFNKDMSGLSKLVSVVLIIVVVSSVYCIKNSFDISICEKIKQYGMLRSVGATKKQIKKNVFNEAYILGIIGIPLGIFLGLFASFILILVSNYLLDDMISMGLKLELSFSLVAILISIVLSYVTIYLSALRSARKAAKISPISAIRNSAEIKINPKKVKTNKLISKIFGIGGVISDKNIKRNKKKYRTTIISIMISVIIFISLSEFVYLFKTAVQGSLTTADYNIKAEISNFDYNSNSKKVKDTINNDYIGDFTLGRVNGLTVKKSLYTKKYINYGGFYPDEQNETYLNVVGLDSKSFKLYLKANNLNYEEYKDKNILFNYPLVEHFDRKSQRIIELRPKALNVKKNYVLDAYTVKKDVKVSVDYISDVYPVGYKNYSRPVLFVNNEVYSSLFNGENEIVELYSNTKNTNKL